MEFRVLPGPPDELVLAAFRVHGATDDAVGIAIAKRRKDPEFARLQSVVVDADHRRKGCATALVRAICRRLAEDGVRQVSVHYDANSPSTTATIALLRRCGFVWPLIVGVGTRRTLEGRWATAALPPNDQLILWRDLDSATIDHLAAECWYPEELSPFINEPIEPLNSLALCVDESLVGWCITQRGAPETIEYSRLFVHPRFRTAKRGLAMLAEAIRRQDAANVPFGRFGVRVENRGMYRFVQRRLAPFLESLEPMGYAELNLA